MSEPLHNNSLNVDPDIGRVGSNQTVPEPCEDFVDCDCFTSVEGLRGYLLCHADLNEAVAVACEYAKIVFESF